MSSAIVFKTLHIRKEPNSNALRKSLIPSVLKCSRLCLSVILAHPWHLLYCEINSEEASLWKEPFNLWTSRCSALNSWIHLRYLAETCTTSDEYWTALVIHGGKVSWYRFSFLFFTTNQLISAGNHTLSLTHTHTHTQTHTHTHTHTQTHTHTCCRSNILFSST